MRRAAPLVVLLAAALLAGGCNIIGPAAYFFGPRRIQKAEYKLTEGRLGVFVDFARPADDNPIFHRALHERLIEIFRERKVAAKVVAFEEVARLRQDFPDLRTWSVQRIGRELEAEEVLYVRVLRLQLREVPDHPVVHPQGELRISVVDSTAADKPRLWPGAMEDRTVSVSRDPKEATSNDLVDAEAAKLGRAAANLLAQYFYDVDLEEKTPREP